MSAVRRRHIPRKLENPVCPGYNAHVIIAVVGSSGGQFLNFGRRNDHALGPPLSENVAATPDQMLS
ncbi:hypothetical protein ACLOJK_032494 [Asimina triloba]